jgi:hypothetical protein
MSTKESIKILIEGEDQASAVMAAVEAKTRASLDNIKQTGNQTKVSLDFVGKIASQLGGSEISAVTGQLGQLIGQTGKFADVAKLGGAGALAFQAGLASLVATIGFSVGKSIGDAIFQTERWKEELAAAEKQAASLNTELLKLTTERFTDSKIDIELISDPDEKRAAYKQLLDDLGNEAAGIAQKIKQAENDIKKRDTFDEDANIFGMFGVETESEKLVKLKREEIETDRERLKLINEQTVALQKQLGERAQERELAAQKKQEIESDQRTLSALEKRLELEKAVNREREDVQAVRDSIKSSVLGGLDLTGSADEFGDRLKEQLQSAMESWKSQFQDASQQFDIQASQTVFGADNQARVASMLEEMEFLKEIQNIEKEIAQERKAALAAQEQEQKRIDDAYAREIRSLEEQAILLRDGKEAAREFALEKQGIAKEDAKRFVEMQRQLEEQQKTDTTKPTSTNTAMESRVMARGDVDSSPAKDTAKNTEEAKKILDEMLAELKNQARQRTEQTEQTKIELVEI